MIAEYDVARCIHGERRVEAGDEWGMRGDGGGRDKAKGAKKTVLNKCQIIWDFKETRQQLPNHLRSNHWLKN